MGKYDQQYYIVFNKHDQESLYLTALQQSEDRDYCLERLNEGLEPLYFENSNREEDLNAGIVRPIKKAHMNINFLIFDDNVHERLKGFNIDGCQFYPSVIIDDNDKTHENFWLANVYKKLDCVDYENSVIKNYKPGKDRYKVKKYSLSERVLDSIEEERRLIFRPENTDMGYTFVHEKIVSIFESFAVDTIRFIRVDQWVAGAQFD